MGRILLPLLRGRPMVEVVLTLAQGNQPAVRRLLADTGAGSARSRFELLLDEQDCLMCGGIAAQAIVLGGAYVGSYPLYLIPVRIPQLGFDQPIPAVGIPVVPVGFDGIAGFRFLDRFTFGNFANPGQFGLAL